MHRPCTISNDVLNGQGEVHSGSSTQDQLTGSRILLESHIISTPPLLRSLRSEKEEDDIVETTPEKVTTSRRRRRKTASNRFTSLSLSSTSPQTQGDSPYLPVKIIKNDKGEEVKLGSRRAAGDWGEEEDIPTSGRSSSTVSGKSLQSSLNYKLESESLGHVDDLGDNNVASLEDQLEVEEDSENQPLHLDGIKSKTYLKVCCKGSEIPAKSSVSLEETMSICSPSSMQAHKAVYNYSCSFSSNQQGTACLQTQHPQSQTTRKLIYSNVKQRRISSEKLHHTLFQDLERDLLSLENSDKPSCRLIDNQSKLISSNDFVTFSSINHVISNGPYNSTSECEKEIFLSGVDTSEDNLKPEFDDTLIDYNIQFTQLENDFGKSEFNNCVLAEKNSQGETGKDANFTSRCDQGKFGSAEVRNIERRNSVTGGITCQQNCCCLRCSSGGEERVSVKEHECSVVLSENSGSQSSLNYNTESIEPNQLNVTSEVNKKAQLEHCLLHNSGHLICEVTVNHDDDGNRNLMKVVEDREDGSQPVSCTSNNSPSFNDINKDKEYCQHVEGSCDLIPSGCKDHVDNFIDSSLVLSAISKPALISEFNHEKDLNDFIGFSHTERDRSQNSLLKFKHFVSACLSKNIMNKEAGGAGTSKVIGKLLGTDETMKLTDCPEFVGEEKTKKNKSSSLSHEIDNVKETSLVCLQGNSDDCFSTSSIQLARPDSLYSQVKSLSKIASPFNLSKRRKLSLKSWGSNSPSSLDVNSHEACKENNASVEFENGKLGGVECFPNGSPLEACSNNTEEETDCNMLEITDQSPETAAPSLLGFTHQEIQVANISFHCFSSFIVKFIPLYRDGVIFNGREKESWSTHESCEKCEGDLMYDWQDASSQCGKTLDNDNSAGSPLPFVTLSQKMKSHFHSFPTSSNIIRERDIFNYKERGSSDDSELNILPQSPCPLDVSPLCREETQSHELCSPNGKFVNICTSGLSEGSSKVIPMFNSKEVSNGESGAIHYMPQGEQIVTHSRLRLDSSCVNEQVDTSTVRNPRLVKNPDKLSVLKQLESALPAAASIVQCPAIHILDDPLAKNIPLRNLGTKYKPPSNNSIIRNENCEAKIDTDVSSFPPPNKEIGESLTSHLANDYRCSLSGETATGVSTDIPCVTDDANLCLTNSKIKWNKNTTEKHIVSFGFSTASGKIVGTKLDSLRNSKNMFDKDLDCNTCETYLDESMGCYLNMCDPDMTKCEVKTEERCNIVSESSGRDLVESKCDINSLFDGQSRDTQSHYEASSQVNQLKISSESPNTSTTVFLSPTSKCTPIPPVNNTFESKCGQTIKILDDEEWLHLEHENNDILCELKSVSNKVASFGFTTGSGKSVSVSDESLMKIKGLFTIDNDSKVIEENVKTNDVDISHCSPSRSSEISRGNSSALIGKIKENLGTIDPPCEPKSGFNKVASFGFSTGSGKSVSVSDESLMKIKGLFTTIDNDSKVIEENVNTNDVDRFESISCAVPVAKSPAKPFSRKIIKYDKTSTNNHFNQCIDKTNSLKPLTVSLTSCQNVDTSHFSSARSSEISRGNSSALIGKIKENLGTIDPPCEPKSGFNKVASFGFTTGSGKSVSVSDESLMKIKGLFTSIDNDSKVIEENVKTNSVDISHYSPSRSGEISRGNCPALIGKIKENLGTIYPPCEPKPGFNKVASFGFTTGSGKSVSVSDESLMKIKGLFTTDNDSKVIEENVKTNNVDISHYSPSRSGEISCGNCPALIGKIKENLGTIDPPCEPKSVSNKVASFGFTTGSGKSVSVSDESLMKIKGLFTTIDNDSFSDPLPHNKGIESNVREISSSYFTNDKSAILSNTQCSGAVGRDGKGDFELSKMIMKSQQTVRKPLDFNSVIEKPKNKIDDRLQDKASDCVDLKNIEKQVGFSTASGKLVAVNSDSFNKVKLLFDENSSQDVKDNNCLNDCIRIDEDDFEGFIEGHGLESKSGCNRNRVSDSTEEVVESGKSKFAGKDTPVRTKRQKLSFVVKEEMGREWQSDKFSGFRTAADKPVGISEESLAKVKLLLNENCTESCESYLSPSEDYASGGITPLPHQQESHAKNREYTREVEPPLSLDVSTRCGYISDTGQPLSVTSSHSSAQVQKNKENKSHVISTDESQFNSNVCTLPPCFNTAGGKSVSVSHDSLDKVKTLLDTCSEPYYNETLTKVTPHSLQSRDISVNDVEKKNDKMNTLLEQEKVSCMTVEYSENKVISISDNGSPKQSHNNNKIINCEPQGGSLDNSFEYFGSQIDFSLAHEISESTAAFLADDERDWSVLDETVTSPTAAHKPTLSTPIRTFDNMMTSTPDSVNPECRKRLAINDTCCTPILKKFKYGCLESVKKWIVKTRMKQMEMIEEKKGKEIAHVAGIHLTLRQQQRHRLDSLKAALKGEKPKRYTYRQLLDKGLKDSVISVNSLNAVDFVFDVKELYVSCKEEEWKMRRAGVVPSVDLKVGLEEISSCFLSEPGVDPSLVSDKWLRNHYRWIVWKLASTERSFPHHFANRCLTVENLLLQLRYRYDREIHLGHRPSISKILQLHQPPFSTIVLCVSQIKKNSSSPEALSQLLTVDQFAVKEIKHLFTRCQGYGPATPLFIDWISVMWLDLVGSTMDASQERKDDGVINILLIGCRDPRHILKTISEIERQRDSEASEERKEMKINFYLLEVTLEVLARQMLLMTVALEPSDRLAPKEKARLWMELYGNSLLRSSSYTYLRNKTVQFVHMVTDRNFLSSRIPQLRLDLLKYKERDGLENIFLFWQREIFRAVKLWDLRMRRGLGTRYDSRMGVFDWDYHMKLKDVLASSDREASSSSKAGGDFGSGNIIIGSREYSGWRNTGVAFTWLETEFSLANPTFAMGINKVGDKLVDFGYLGDIQVGPYFTFGLECRDKEMLKTINGLYAHRCTDVFQHNLMEIFHRIEHGGEYCRDSGEDSGLCLGTVTLSQIAVVEDTPPSVSQEPLDHLTREQYQSIPSRHTVTFLPLTSLNDLHKKENFKCFFHIVYLSEYLLDKCSKELLETASRPQSQLVIETHKPFFYLKAEDKTKFGARIEDFARESGFKKLWHFDAERDYYAFFKKTSNKETIEAPENVFSESN